MFMKLLVSVTGVEYLEKRTLNKERGTNEIVGKHICRKAVSILNNDKEYRFLIFAKLFWARYVIKNEELAESAWTEAEELLRIPHLPIVAQICDSSLKC